MNPKPQPNDYLNTTGSRIMKLVMAFALGAFLMLLACAFALAAMLFK